MIKLFVSRAFVKTKKFEFKESDSLKEIERNIFNKFEKPDNFEFYLHLDNKKNILFEYKDIKKHLKSGNTIYAEQRPLDFAVNPNTQRRFNRSFWRFWVGTTAGDIADARSEINARFDSRHALLSVTNNQSYNDLTDLQEKLIKSSKVLLGGSLIKEVFGLFRTKGTGRLANDGTYNTNQRIRRNSAGENVQIETIITRTFRDVFLIGSGDLAMHYLDIAGSGQDVSFGNYHAKKLITNTYKADYKILTPSDTVSFNVQRNQDFVLTDLDVNNLIPSNTILTNFGLDTLNEVYKAVDSVGLKFSETISNATARFDFFETDWILSVKDKAVDASEDKWSKYYYEYLTAHPYASEEILDYILGIGYEVVPDPIANTGVVDLKDPEQNFNIVLDNATNSYKSASLISAELGENEIGQISGSYFLNQVTPAGIYFKLRSDKDVYLPRTSVASGASARERMKQESIYSGSKQIGGGASGNEARGKAVGDRDSSSDLSGSFPHIINLTANDDVSKVWLSENFMNLGVDVNRYSSSGSLESTYNPANTRSDFNAIAYKDSQTLYLYRSDPPSNNNLHRIVVLNPSTMTEDSQRNLNFTNSTGLSFISAGDCSLNINGSDLILLIKKYNTTAYFVFFSIASDGSLTRNSSSDFTIDNMANGSPDFFTVGNRICVTSTQENSTSITYQVYVKGSDGSYSRDSSQDFTIDIGSGRQYNLCFYRNNKLYLSTNDTTNYNSSIRAYEGFPASTPPSPSPNTNPAVPPSLSTNAPATLPSIVANNNLPDQSLNQTDEDFPPFDDITSTVSGTDNFWTVNTGANELRRIELDSSPSGVGEVPFTNIATTEITSPEALAYVRGEVLVYNGSNIKSYIASNLVENTSRSTDVTGLTGTVQSMTADSTHIAILTKGASGAYNVYFWNYTQSGRFTRNASADFSFNESLLGTVASGNEIKGLFFAKGSSNTLTFTSTRTNKILCYTRISASSYRRDANKEVPISVNFASFANDVFAASTYSRGYFVLGRPSSDSTKWRLIFFDYSVTFNFNYNTEVDALDPEDQITLPAPDKDPVKFDKLKVSERNYKKATGNARSIWALRGNRTIDVLNYDLESISDDVVEVVHPYAKDSAGNPYKLSVYGLDLHNDVLVVLAGGGSFFQTILFYDTTNNYNLIDYIELSDIDGEATLKKKPTPPSTKTTNKIKSSGSNRRTSKLRPSGATGDFFGLLAGLVIGTIASIVGYMTYRSLTDDDDSNDKSSSSSTNTSSSGSQTSSNSDPRDFDPYVRRDQIDSDGFRISSRGFTDITFNGKWIYVASRTSAFFINYETRDFGRSTTNQEVIISFSFKNFIYNYIPRLSPTTLYCNRIDNTNNFVQVPANNVSFTTNFKNIRSTFARDDFSFYILGENTNGDITFEKVDIGTTISEDSIDLTGIARPLPEVTIDDPTDVPQPPPELEFTDSPFDITFNSIKSDSSSSIPSISFIKGNFVFTLDDIRSVTNGNTRQLSQVTTYDFKARHKSTKARTPAEDFSITTSDLSSLSSGVTDFNGVTNNFASGTESLSELVKVLVKGDLYYLVMKTSTGKTARTLYAFDDTGSRSATDDIALSAFNPITKTAKSGRTFSERKMKLDQSEFIGDLLLVPYLQAYTATDGQRDEFYMVIAFDTAGSLVSYKVFDVGNFSNTSLTEFTRQGMNFNFNDLTGAFTDGTDYFLKDNFATPKRYRAYSPVIETEVSARSFGLPTIPVNTGQTGGLYVVSDGSYVWFTGRRRTLYAFNLLSPTAVPSPDSNVDLAYKSSKDITFDGTNEVATTNGLKFTFRDGENVYTESSALTARSVSDTANITFACRNKNTGARLQSNNITISKSSLTSLMTKTSFTGSDVAVNAVKNVFLNGSYVYIYLDAVSSGSGNEDQEGITPNNEGGSGLAAGDRIASSDVTFIIVDPFFGNFNYGAFGGATDGTNFWTCGNGYLIKNSLTGGVLINLGLTNAFCSSMDIHNNELLVLASGNIASFNKDDLSGDSTRTLSLSSLGFSGFSTEKITTDGVDVLVCNSIFNYNADFSELESITFNVRAFSYTSSGAFTRKSASDFSFNPITLFGETNSFGNVVSSMFFTAEGTVCFISESSNKVIVYRRGNDGTYSRDTSKEFNLATNTYRSFGGFFHDDVIYIIDGFTDPFGNVSNSSARAFDGSGLGGSSVPDGDPAYKLFAFNKSTGARSATNDITLSDFTALTKTAPTGRTLQSKKAHLKDSVFISNKLYTLCDQEYENSTNSDGQTRFYFLMPFSLTGTATTADAIDINRVSITGSGESINYSTESGIHIDTDNMYRSLWSDTTDIFIRGNGYEGYEAFYPYNPTSKFLVNTKIMGIPTDKVIGDSTLAMNKASFNVSDGTYAWFNGKNDTLFAYELSKAYVNFNNNYYIDLHLETDADTESLKLDIPYRTNFYFNDINLNKIVNVSLDYTFNVPTIKIVFQLTQEQYKTLGSADRIFIRESTGEFVFLQIKTKIAYISKRSFAQKHVDENGKWSLVAPKENSKLPVYVFELEGTNKTGIKGREGSDLLLKDGLTLASQRSTSYYMVDYPKVSDLTGNNAPDGLQDLSLRFTSETFTNSPITKLNCYRHTYADFNPSEDKTLTLGSTLTQGRSITFDSPSGSGSLLASDNIVFTGQFFNDVTSSDNDTNIWGCGSFDGNIYKYSLSGGSPITTGSITGVSRIRALTVVGDYLIALTYTNIYVLDKDTLVEDSTRRTSLTGITPSFSSRPQITTDGQLVFVSYNDGFGSTANCVVRVLNYTTSGSFTRNSSLDFQFNISSEFGSTNSDTIRAMMYVNNSLNFISNTPASENPESKTVAFTRNNNSFERNSNLDMSLPNITEGVFDCAFFRDKKVYLVIGLGSNTTAHAVDAYFLQGEWSVGTNPISVYPERVFFSYSDNISSTGTALNTRVEINYKVEQVITRKRRGASLEDLRKEDADIESANDTITENIENYKRALDTTLSFYVSRKIYDPIGDRFIESSNPANICLHLLSELYDSLDLPITFTDFVDTQSFADFRTWCFDSANDFEFNGEFGSSTTYLDALQIVASAGRGTILFGFGKISVYIDRSQTNVSQHFHAGNISSITIQKTIRKVPALLEAVYYDKAEGYEKNTLSVRTDPTDTTGNSKQTINVQGIVESDKVTDRLNFEIKKLNNQPEIYTITVDLAAVRCEVGDLVGVNYEMLQASQFTGTVRKQNLSNNLVASVLINQDTAPELDPTKMYSFVVLNNDGTTLSIPVTSISDEKEPDSLTSELASDKKAFERKLRDSSMNTANRGQTFKKITFSSPANPTQVPVGARFIFGENTNVFKKALVLSIQSDSNLLGTVTLQEYIPAWYS